MILLDEVAAAEQAVQMERNKTFGIDADFIFVDASRDHCAALRNRIVTSPYSYNLDKKITIRCDTFADAYEEIEASILARKGKRRALFFLDQYGYSDVPLSLIRRILSKIEGAEIILTFAIDSLINYLHDSEQFE
ncbi:hypothetical protein BGC31_00285 [Komagataeibacter xylinus]|nr:hypothetical protein BFX83_00795 [Komagataeibacter xylinus]RFP07275.1 hypothetical protein BGC31_00285 [Komagataeibacter xylinus]